MVKTVSFEIIAGTYEEFLLGYTFSSKTCKLTQTFAAHDHSSSIRTVCQSNNYIASGGADDRIFVYDIKTRSEHCSLVHNNSTVNCLQFTENHSHIISGSADGVLSIVRVGNWQLEKVWDKAHKGEGILDIAVHPSGKMALTLGANSTLVTWNLVKGRQAYVINLNSKCKNPKSLERVLLSPDENKFLLYGGKSSDLWSIETGGVVEQIEHAEKVTACAWLNPEEFLVGFEDGQLIKVTIGDDMKEIVQAHQNRIKAIAVYKKYIVTGSSSGTLKVWNKNFDELAQIESGCRITCLTIVPPIKMKKEDLNEETVVKKIEVANPKLSKPRVQIIENSENEEVEPKIITKPVNKKRQKVVIEDEAKVKLKNKKKSKKSAAT